MSVHLTHGHFLHKVVDISVVIKCITEGHGSGFFLVTTGLYEAWPSVPKTFHRRTEFLREAECASSRLFDMANLGIKGMKQPSQIRYGDLGCAFYLHFHCFSVFGMSPGSAAPE